MSELLNFYKKAFAFLAVSLATLAVFVPDRLIPYLETTFGSSHVLAIGATWLTSRPAFVLFLFFGELLIRKWAWKIVHPELNFQGEWEGTTTYTNAEPSTPSTPFSANHKVKFEQDCLSFSIAPTTANSFVNWSSLAINLSDKDIIRYAYEVNYTDSNKFPGEAIGYEEMKVIEREPGRKQRPTALTGKFYHCAMGLHPIYRGTVLFKRKKS